MSLHSIRLGLIFLLIGGGILMHAQTGWTPAWYFYLTAVVLLFTHFRYANVWVAFSQMRKGNILEAEAMLNKIRLPEWLAKSPRAYYHFSKGMIYLQNKELTSAEPHLKEALNLGLRTANDHALAALNLAHIHFVKKDKKAAKDMLQKAKSFMPNDLMIKENIKKMEAAM